MSRILYTPRDQRVRRGSGRLKFRRAAAVFMIAFFCFGIAYGTRLPYIQINDIRIGGAVALSPEEIRIAARNEIAGAYAFFIPRDSFVAVRTAKIEAALKDEFSRIREVKVTKVFPQTLTIAIRERSLFAILCNSAHCFFIDDTGFAYEEAPSSSGSLVLKIKTDDSTLSFPAAVLDSALIREMREIAEQMKDVLRTETVGFELFSKIPREMRIKTKEGFMVYVNRDGNFRNTLGVVKTVIEREIKEKYRNLEYIDARFGNKVFYRLKK